MGANVRRRDGLHEVVGEVVDVLEADRQAHDRGVRLRLAGDRPVRERGRVLDEGVDPAERHGVGHELARLREPRRGVVAARELERDDRPRAGELRADEPGGSPGQPG